ncbi:C39 family peptidase [Eubacterium multiforme]|uniref:SH3b domain-containing protein n=1 Tax=Eubacterium multiforme TaxID=83339 RepID=A0ABT9UP85_9FIRM|nr:C39 family peptidase [Eubacterium multiforme]MDQ0148458.1 hypothetical protein [Eubacterium multiforme]
MKLKTLSLCNKIIIISSILFIIILILSIIIFKKVNHNSKVINTNSTKIVPQDSNDSKEVKNSSNLSFGIANLNSKIDNLNLLEEPYNSSAISCKIPNSSIVNILEKEKNFYKVKYNNKTGYLKEDYLTKCNSNKINPSDLSSTIKEDFIRYYAQDDPRYGNNIYSIINNKSQIIANSACAPTAFAIVASTLNNTDISPPELCKYSIEKNTRTTNRGTDSKFFKIASSDKSKPQYNLNLTYTSSIREVKRLLNDKKHLVIANMCPGHVTKGGHYIVLSGYKKINNSTYFKVYDPHCYNQFYIYDGTIIDNIKNDGFILLKQSVLANEGQEYFVFSSK